MYFEGITAWLIDLLTTVCKKKSGILVATPKLCPDDAYYYSYNGYIATIATSNTVTSLYYVHILTLFDYFVLIRMTGIVLNL